MCIVCVADVVHGALSIVCLWKKNCRLLAPAPAAVSQGPGQDSASPTGAAEAAVPGRHSLSPSSPPSVPPFNAQGLKMSSPAAPGGCCSCYCMLTRRPGGVDFVPYHEGVV